LKKKIAEEDTTSRYATDPVFFLFGYFLLIVQPNYISLTLFLFLPLLLPLYLSFDKEISIRNTSVSGDYSITMEDEQTNEDLVFYFSTNYFCLEETLDAISEEEEESLSAAMEVEEEDLNDYSEDQQDREEIDLYEEPEGIYGMDFPHEGDFDFDKWRGEIFFIYSWNLEQTWLRKKWFQAMEWDPSTPYDPWQLWSLYAERGYNFTGTPLSDGDDTINGDYFFPLGDSDDSARHLSIY